MKGREVGKEKYTGGVGNREEAKRNKVSNGVWRWVCFPSIKAEGCTVACEEEGGEPGTPSWLPYHLTPSQDLSALYWSWKQVFSDQQISFQYKYHTYYCAGASLVSFLAKVESLWFALANWELICFVSIENFCLVLSESWIWWLQHFWRHKIFTSIQQWSEPEWSLLK